MPSRDSLFLACDNCSSSFPALAPQKHCSSDVKSRESGVNNKRNRNTMSIRALDWTIGRINLSLRQLFVSLYLWKSESLTAVQVSDVFVRLATDFNATMAMLVSYDILALELHPFEQRLREVLEQYLNEAPLAENYNQCISGLEAVLNEILPKLESKHTALKQMLA